MNVEPPVIKFGSKMLQELQSQLRKLRVDATEDLTYFYLALSDVNLGQDSKDKDEFVETVLPQIYQLYEQNVLSKDLVYLSLVSSENYDTLNCILNYDKSVFNLDITNSTSLYDYCIYNQRHWLHEVINRSETFEPHILSKVIYDKILLLKLIELTSLPNIDLDEIKRVVGQIHSDSLEDFWNLYVDEFKQLVDTVNFCQEINSPADTTTIIRFASQNSCLETLSQFNDLSESQNWEGIIERIQEKGPNELDVITGFVVIATLMKLLFGGSFYHANITSHNDSICNLAEDVKNKLSNIHEKRFQIELLEDIFSLIFNQNAFEQFVCKEKEIRVILFLLKSTISDLIYRNVHQDKTSLEYQRLNSLNKNLADALWRLDLISSAKKSPKIDDRLVNYMLAPAESLIHICLKGDDFPRAYQVIEIFGMGESDIAREIRYADKYAKLGRHLRKPVSKTVQEFLTDNLPGSGTEIDEVGKKFPIFNNSYFTSLFDLIVTQLRSRQDCQALIKLAKEHLAIESDCSYLKVFDRLVNSFESSDRETVTEILMSNDNVRVTSEFRDSLCRLFDNFHLALKNSSDETGRLNEFHPTHSILLKINETCHGSSQFVQKLYNYLHVFSKILYIEVDSSDIVAEGKNTSYFQLLNHNRSELTGKLLFEKNLDPAEFERYFGKLKLDFLYHVVGNCFPTINLHVNENVTIEELYHDNMLYIPSPSIIVYIQKRNWLLAFILNEMYKVEGVKIDISEARLKTFFNYMGLPRVQNLKVLFDNNEIVTALQNCLNPQKLKIYFKEHLIKQDLAAIASHSAALPSVEDVETGEEMSEDTRITTWKSLYDIVDSIPESQMMKKSEFLASRDDVLVNLVQDGFERNFHNYVYFIDDRKTRCDVILNNLHKWSSDVASDVIKSELTRFNGVVPPGDCKLDLLNDWLVVIQLNEKLKSVFGTKTWYQSHEFCQTEMDDAFAKIISAENVNLLLDFIKLYKPTEEILRKLDSINFARLIDREVPIHKIKLLFDNLPFNQTIETCTQLITLIRKLNYLEFITNYLSHNVPDDKALQSVQLSLNILATFTQSEQEQYYPLVNQPLSILEVLIMNTKLDKLGCILDLLQQDNDSLIGSDKIDRLLRVYAEKSLEFRVITRPTSKSSVRTPECKLLQSLDSSSNGTERRQFVVPENVPAKDEWVANEEALECMCCRHVVFSMFNRRHHCRRCGRVVCYNCSLKRMLVPTYEDILVRVCIDCHDQTAGSSSAPSSDRSDLSIRSTTSEFWILNDDFEHNKIVREEFSYEHAPSTSLCLSILRYHSKNSEYPKFLLEQCDVMLKLLQPSGQEPTAEIDYMLVVKMLKSLAVAAKMQCQMLSSGVAHADRILSQAEILALLASRGCLNLMPVLPNSHIDAVTLRKLRDKLLHREQWTLALEVSTKAGLDNTGVFAAWGKSCLRAGRLNSAREKFQRCLEKGLTFDAPSCGMGGKHSDANKSTDSLLSRLRFSSNMSTVSVGSEGGVRAKDPPLLAEIVQILESQTRAVDPVLSDQKGGCRVSISGSMSSLSHTPLFSQHAPDTAVSILSRIKNLGRIASGIYNLSANDESAIKGPTIDPLFYDECVHYLSRYGAPLSLLEFYVRHGDIHRALEAIIENRLSSDLFVEIYMRCLRDGIVDRLQENMSRIDSSLYLWKDHLKVICRHLESQNLLNSLYQLQLYMGDYVRAAMTCVRFYGDGVRNFGEFQSNTKHLHKTEEHLRQCLEQDQWVDVTSSSEAFEEKTLADPEIVMKIDAKEVDRHILTVKRQIELVNFLTKREELCTVNKPIDLMAALYQLGSGDQQRKVPGKIPTLFGSTTDKTVLTTLVLVTGDNGMEEGFELAVRLIHEFKIRPMKVYCLAAKMLAQSERYSSITQLVGCIKVAGVDDPAISDMLDTVLVQAVGTLVKANVTGTKVEDLIKLIKDRATKISAYIEAKQLKTAYFLAVKYKRTADLRRIQREAELLNIPSIKALCQKILQQSSGPKES